MNLPNRLTVGRLFLTAFFVLCFYLPWGHAMTAALLIFSLASITDWLDGRSARARNLVTHFGKLFDPLADKVLIAAAFILLVENTKMKAWIAIAILGREFFVTGIRLIAAQQGVVLAAERLGKHKMFWQILTVLYFLLGAASREWLFSFLRPWYESTALQTRVGFALVAVTTFLTLLSGLTYFWRNRRLFDDA